MVSAGAIALLLLGSGKATNAQVVAAVDDGTSFGSSTFWSNSTADVWLGIENNVAAHTMYRMRLHVPQGATITKAYSRLRARGTDSGTTVNVRIYAEDVDNATAVTGYSDFNSRTMTTAYTDWSSVAAWTTGVDYDTPDISAVIQEIVDRSGWVSGSYIGIYIKDNGSTGTASRRASSYDDSTTNAPKLHVEFTPPAASGQMTFVPARDTFLDQNSPTSAPYNETLATRNNTNLLYIPLLHFDVSALSGRTITRARLVFTFDQAISTGFPRRVAAHAILAANSGWLHSASWNYADGAGATDRWAGDTGNDGGTDAGCSVAGTDYNADPMGVVKIGSAVSVGDTVTFELAPSQVQAWVTGSNYGLVLRSHTTDGFIVESSETGVGNERPRLILDYAATPLSFAVQPDGTTGKDTNLAQNLPDSGGSSATIIRVRSALDGVTNSATQTGLIEFDLSSIPSGSTILGATLRLVLDASNTVNAKSVALFKLLAANASWDEAATWNYRVPSTTRWAGDTGSDGGTDAGCTVAGTDYDSTELGRIGIAPSESSGRAYEMSLGPGLSLVQAAFGGALALTLKSDNGDDNLDLRSSDHATAADRPKLTVWYTTGSGGNPWYYYAQQR